MRRNITMAEVKQHRTEDDAWLVYNGKVVHAASLALFRRSCSAAVSITAVAMQLCSTWCH